MNKNVNVNREVEVYMQQFETSFGYIGTSEYVLHQYIERGRKEFRKDWIDYINEMQK